MKAIRQLLAATALCVLGVAPALAQGTNLTNGDFGTPTASLTAWTTEGDVMVTGSKNVAALTTASAGNDDDAPLPAGFNNNSGTAAVDFFYAADLAGVSLAALDAAGAGPGETYEGSAIRQDFYATAGDKLTISFDWAFLSVDQTFADFAFVSINGSVVKFVDAFSAPAASHFNNTFGDLNDVTWGWTGADYTYTATSDGQVSLVIGVVDIGDASGTSELRVDNIAVSAVPEPATYAMLLAGLALMGGIARRRQG